MIGRQGLVIKSMSEQSNCQMQLAEMNDPYDTKERIMVINGKNGSVKDLIQVSLNSYRSTWGITRYLTLNFTFNFGF